MNDISDNLSKLNPRQKEAVTAPNGPLLVTAGAGSGKTAVLVNRIAWLISEKQVPADRIIAVTFTNKAAREMKQRVQDMLWEESVNPVVGTFHGLCNQFLRIHYQAAGLNQYFSIMDQDDQKSFISGLVREQNIELNKSQTPRRIQTYINSRKESMLRAGENDDIYSSDYRLFESIYELYETECEAQGRVDFAELMLRTVEVMQRNAEVREHIQKKYLHVLIDEFQDTNELQYKWMLLFGGRYQNITAVGDEDQSIYSWRGALSGNLKRFEATYPKARVIRLEQNYRSTKSILDAANALIKNNTNRFEKKLWTGKSGGNRIQHFVAFNSVEEAEFIANEIRHLVKPGRKYSDFAVLYRTNAQSRTFEEVFGRERIPFRVYGGVRFYQRKEIKEVLSYLQLVANPNANDALLRAIKMPPRGIGQVTIRAIADRADAKGISFWDATVELTQEHSKGKSLATFVELINDLKNLSETTSLRDIIDITMKQSKLYKHYEESRDPAERDRVANLDELISAASAFVETMESDLSADVLSEYLDTVVLDPGDIHDDEPHEKVQFMTLHSAKGLEFPVVFLTGLDEKVLPHIYSTPGGNRSPEYSQEAIEEERRLCYVGMTRAEEKLYLTRANSRMIWGDWYSFLQSRFLREIPRGLLEIVGAGSSVEEEFEIESDEEIVIDPGAGDWLGEAVRHKKFGSGVVTMVEPAADSVYLTVEFEKFGAKTVLPEYVEVESGH